jgi:hypothetical protein
MFWGYAADMEEGLVALRRGDKANAYELLDAGCRFDEWLYSRRFEENDLSDFGYRRGKGRGPSEGFFASAEVARDMNMIGGIFNHTDELRRDGVSLPDRHLAAQRPSAEHFKIPYGVPPGVLPPLPPLDPSAPTVMSGEQVPALGIWVVEPDAAHRGQTYCMAYLRPWWPALETVSEQEHEANTRWIRTFDDAYRKDCDAIKEYPVRWRLLWRDDRDYNGRTPPEESDYLVYRGERVQTPPPVVRMRCEGGQPCPRDGTWFTPSGGGVRRHFKAGELMPDLKSQWGVTIWQLES